jgi:hypothetical protein
MTTARRPKLCPITLCTAAGSLVALAALMWLQLTIRGMQ